MQKQKALVLDSSRKAAKSVIRSDHSVTRNDNKERVFPDCISDRAGRPSLTECRRDLSIAFSMAKLDF